MLEGNRKAQEIGQLSTWFQQDRLTKIVTKVLRRSSKKKIKENWQGKKEPKAKLKNQEKVIEEEEKLDENEIELKRNVDHS